MQPARRGRRRRAALGERVTSVATERVAILVRAYALAARAHANQTRKGDEGIPYINHCCEVAELVAWSGAPLETLVAAVLHDVVEDSDTTTMEIEAAFGTRVASLVAGMTDAPEWESLPRRERKRHQAAHMRHADREVRRIKIADQTSNVRDIAREPEAWDGGDAAGYIEGAEMVVEACRGADPILEAVFDTAVTEAMAKIGGDSMIPGEIVTPAGHITLNEGLEAITVVVANTGDRPVQVGSHYHFAETNPALDFDREAARGRRLDIAAGTAARFEPGQRREVRLVPYRGDRRIFGFNAAVMGNL